MSNGGEPRIRLNVRSGSATDVPVTLLRCLLIAITGPKDGRDLFLRIASENQVCRVLQPIELNALAESDLLLAFHSASRSI